MRKRTQNAIFAKLKNTISFVLKNILEKTNWAIREFKLLDNKQKIVIWVIVAILTIVLSWAFTSKKWPKEIITWQKSNYFESTKTTTVTSAEISNLKEIMKERWQIQEIGIKLNKNNLEIKTNTKPKTSTMTQLELDASESWLTEWEIYELSIPSADVNSQIMIPWRYRYMISFKQSGEQQIILKWNWNKIVWTINIQ